MSVIAASWDLDLAEAADSLAKASTPKKGLETAPGKSDNWVERSGPGGKGGSLPAYVQHIALAIMKKRGIPKGTAIAYAIGTIKKWARGGGNVDGGTKAAAAKALGEWEAMKARSKAKDLVHGWDGVTDEGLDRAVEVLEAHFMRLRSGLGETSLEEAREVTRGVLRYPMPLSSGAPARQRDVREVRAEVADVLAEVIWMQEAFGAHGKRGTKTTTAPPKAAKPEVPEDPEETGASGPLRKGHKGERVKHLQNRLNTTGESLVVDGDFGEETDKAVKGAQARGAEREDGVVGPVTTDMLRQMPSGRTLDPTESPEEKRSAEARAKGEDPAAGAGAGAGGPEKGGKGADEPKPEPVPDADGDAGAEPDGDADDAPAVPKGVLYKGKGVGGAADKDVKALQHHLGATADGSFGPKTDAKLKAYQRHQGLKADGIYGPKTERVMKRAAKISTKVEAANDAHTPTNAEEAAVHIDESENHADEALWARCKADASKQSSGKDGVWTIALANRLYKKRGGSFKGGKGADAKAVTTAASKLNEDEVRWALDGEWVTGVRALAEAAGVEALEITEDTDLDALEAALEEMLVEQADAEPRAYDGLSEALVARGGNRATAALKRLPNGHFAPKGQGNVLRAGDRVSVPHRDPAQPDVTAKVEGGGRTATLTTGPDAGSTINIAPRPRPNASQALAQKMSQAQGVQGPGGAAGKASPPTSGSGEGVNLAKANEISNGLTIDKLASHGPGGKPRNLKAMSKEKLWAIKNHPLTKPSFANAIGDHLESAHGISKLHGKPLPASRSNDGSGIQSDVVAGLPSQVGKSKPTAAEAKAAMTASYDKEVDALAEKYRGMHAANVSAEINGMADGPKKAKAREAQKRAAVAANKSAAASDATSAAALAKSHATAAGGAPAPSTIKDPRPTNGTTAGIDAAAKKLPGAPKKDHRAETIKALDNGTTDSYGVSHGEDVGKTFDHHLGFAKKLKPNMQIGGSLGGSGAVMRRSEDGKSYQLHAGPALDAPKVGKAHSTPEGVTGELVKHEAAHERKGKKEAEEPAGSNEQSPQQTWNAKMAKLRLANPGFDKLDTAERDDLMTKAGIGQDPSIAASNAAKKAAAPPKPKAAAKTPQSEARSYIDDVAGDDHEGESSLLDDLDGNKLSALQLDSLIDKVKKSSPNEGHEQAKQHALAHLAGKVDGAPRSDASGGTDEEKLKADVKANAGAPKAAGGAAKAPEGEHPSMGAAWAAHDKKKAEFDAVDPADKAQRAKIGAQHRATKARIKKLGGDPNNRPAHHAPKGGDGANVGGMDKDKATEKHGGVPTSNYDAVHAMNKKAMAGLMAALKAKNEKEAGGGDSPKGGGGDAGGKSGSGSAKAVGHIEADNLKEVQHERAQKAAKPKATPASGAAAAASVQADGTTKAAVPSNAELEAMSSEELIDLAGANMTPDNPVFKAVHEHMQSRKAQKANAPSPGAGSAGDLTAQDPKPPAAGGDGGEPGSIGSLPVGSEFTTKDGTSYTVHKATSSGFIIAKPVGGGKAKPFHAKFAPASTKPVAGEPVAGGDVSGADAPAAPAASGGGDDLYNQLKASVAQAKAKKAAKAAGR